MFDDAIKESIIETASVQDAYLKKLIRNPDITRHYENSHKPYKKLKFLIARQWNSWYPSYFNSEGGCYAITTRDPELDPYKNSGVIVIDPGFGFMVSLRKHFHIEPQDIKKIFVSHFHPDHMAGLIEFATLSYESEYPCEVFLNSTSYAFFKAFQGKYLHINEIKSGQIKRLYQYDYKSSTHLNQTVAESAFVRMVDTHHSEIGQRHNSLGFIFDFQQIPKNNPSRKISQKVGILGDTDGNKQYIPGYLQNFSDVDILILHLGSIKSKKFEIGDAHLYLDGVVEILKEIISKQNQIKTKLILLSEFGLELGTTKDIVKLLTPLLESQGFSLFLCHGTVLINSDNYFENEINAHLIDKVWVNLEQKIKTELSEKEIEEIICTLGLFCLAISREESFEYIAEKHDESRNKVKLKIKRQSKNNLSKLFLNIIRILKTPDPEAYFEEIRNTAEKLHPKCKDLIDNLPIKNREKSKDNIKNLYLNLCNHSSCRDVFLTTREKEILNNHTHLTGSFSEQSTEDEVSDILKINNRIANLKIQDVWNLADIILKSLAELSLSKTDLTSINTITKSKIILKELPDYLVNKTVPTQCANAGSSIILFENSFRKNTLTSFRFVDENGNGTPYTTEENKS